MITHEPPSIPQWLASRLADFDGTQAAFERLFASDLSFRADAIDAQHNHQMRPVILHRIRQLADR